jgi:hypothetical protein
MVVTTPITLGMIRKSSESAKILRKFAPDNPELDLDLRRHSGWDTSVCFLTWRVKPNYWL